jgi:hypothetical protein
MSCYFITMGALPRQEQKCKWNSDAVSTGVIADTSLGTYPRALGKFPARFLRIICEGHNFGYAGRWENITWQGKAGVESAEFKGAVSFEAKKSLLLRNRSMVGCRFDTHRKDMMSRVTDLSLCFHDTKGYRQPIFRFETSGLNHTARLQKGP